MEHTCHQPPSDLHMSITLPTAGPAGPGGGTPQHREVEAGSSCIASSKLDGVMKSCQKQVRMLPSSQHFRAGFKTFSAKSWVSGGSCSGTLASLEVWQIPYTPYAGAKHGYCGVGISQEDIFPISRDTNQCCVSNLKLILIKS